MKCKIDDLSFAKLLFKDVSVQTIASGATKTGFLNKQVDQIFSKRERENERKRRGLILKAVFIYCFFLFSQSKSNAKMWKRKYVILRENFIFYYKKATKGWLVLFFVVFLVANPQNNCK